MDPTQPLSTPPSADDDRGPDAHALDRLPWPVVRRRLAHDPRLILAVGSLEQYGPHLPIGTGTLIAEHVVRELSQRLGILRAPTFSYGVNLPGSDRFPGTAGIRRKTLHRTVNELFSSWEDHGVTEFLVVTATRSEPHMDALLMALTSHARTTVIDLFALGVSRTDPHAAAPSHAGETETSILLHLRPDLVDSAAAVDAPAGGRMLRRYVSGRPLTPPEATGGVIGRPTRADPAAGRRILDRWITELVGLLSRGDSPTGNSGP